MVEEALHQITQAIPNIRWLRFVSMDGLGHPTYMYDSDGHLRNTDLDRHEDRKSAMTAAGIALSERMIHELVLGVPRTVVLGGSSGTYFLLPIGDGNKWVIAFVINGHPPIDETLKYFQDRDYLASLLPFLDAKS